MQLNIYLISHPIIKILSNSIIYNNESINNKNEKKYLSLFLIYEIMRKRLTIKKIYIKQIFDLKTIYKLEPSQQNYIITNLSKTYFVIGEINTIIPNFNIINIDYFDSKEIILKKFDTTIKNKTKVTKIIIFEILLTSINILNLIETLINNMRIKIEELDIACIACNKKILNEISYKYPKLNIYTAKIII